jgi:hypothetical protein
VKWALPLALLVAGCAGRPEQVIVEKPVEVKVPVAVPCVVNKPSEPTSLRDRVPRATWDAMTTDQREKLAQAQAMERKAFGDRLTIATAGCA